MSFGSVGNAASDNGTDFYPSSYSFFFIIYLFYYCSKVYRRGCRVFALLLGAVLFKGFVPSSVGRSNVCTSRLLFEQRLFVPSELLCYSSPMSVSLEDDKMYP
jgi:hypothetical protein